MGSSKPGKKNAGKKKRVAFRRNRSRKPRANDWTEQARQADDHELDAPSSEMVRAKGELSRHRTIVERDADAAGGAFNRGVVIAMRGLYAEVNDGERVWSCTIRRVLRTRLIEDRHPVVVGDRVLFRIPSSGHGSRREGVIESVEPRKTQLRRRAGRRIQTMVANVDQVVIVASAAEPAPHPHLIDRYLVASLASGLTPVICMNKMDLDDSGQARDLLERYEALGHATVATSVTSDKGMDALRTVFKDQQSVVAGQSGVGKSSLLNALQPGLRLQTASVSAQSSLGRHTTTTAHLFELDFGGYVVDTPGIRSLDLSIVARNEYEAYFTEFAEHLAHCQFADCTHTHETRCSVKAAVEAGDIHPERYQSYVRLFQEPGIAR